MLEYDAAKRVAQLHLDDINSALVLYPWPVTKRYGWIFFFQDRRYLETGEGEHELMGNAPFLVERSNGSIVTFGTAYPVETYITEYERAHGLSGEAIQSAVNIAIPPPIRLTDEQVDEAVAALRIQFPLIWRRAVEAQRSPFGAPVDDPAELHRATRRLGAQWPFVVQAPEPLWLLLELDQRVLQAAAAEAHAA